mmetsp:Transcript_39654/g.45147  ORF Transcript_39654/g.45147 Transcript_39654/m.45147 type:complete len:135 (-) Transcript_39654:237-641(-)|eukprot:CAMPEP_0115004004 /NCGR_PEP_ID=MMETSP0216-20121206/18949_1 /TAXON_ID=223996 /ORGANISM="Protocruzia adherens, Strain Boccale" /LENGTH=134 /DNA_ID=CAMNT_0002369919 /DNA_START=54 /DNA_END=458 /DNA_ORIENTATION=+
MADKSSIRLHHAPGGSSNLSLGSDPSEESKTSVKVHQRPGGNSNIFLGHEDPNADVTTSVKVHHAPGGKSNFSLGGEESEPVVNKRAAVEENKAANVDRHGFDKDNLSNNKSTDTHTSVRVKNPPGGRSNFSLG